MVDDHHLHSADTEPAPFGFRPEVPRQRVDALLARLEDPGRPKWGGREAIHHYRLDRIVGRGSFGRVHLATDPKLDRKVAIKELSFASSHDLVRLEREARALAKLSHPNVVQVYDSGVIDESTYYIAMEYVDGPSLAKWQASAERSLAEILTLYLQAAEGLLAVHRAGLVHRDFKPANVVVAQDGRARVLDFGLALVEHPGTQEAMESSAGQHVSYEPAFNLRLDAENLHVIANPDADPTADDDRACVADPSAASDDLRSPSFHYERVDALTGHGRTTVGRFVGTPVYASPEQFLQQALDSRADQYSLCASLFEAVYGVLPIPPGDAFHAHANKVIEGEIEWPKDSGRVPAWLRRLLRRGLSRDPDDRHESLEPIVAEIRAHLQPRRRWPWVLGAAAVALGGYLTPRIGSEPPACGDHAEDLAGIWDDPTRGALVEALETRVNPRRASLVAESLDGYAASWSEERQGACQREQVSSTERPDPAVACLERRLEDLGAIVQILQESTRQDGTFDVDETTLWEALPLDPRLCSEPGLVVDPAMDEPSGVAVSTLSRLRRARVERVVGRYESSATLAAEARDRARAEHHRGLEAASLYHLGVAQSLAGSWEDARGDLLAAAVAAEEQGMDLLAIDAFAHFVNNAVMHRSALHREVGRDNDAELDMALRLALAKLDALHVSDTELEARVRTAAAHLHNERREWVQAEAQYDAASRILVAARGRDDFMVAGLDINRAAVMAKIDGRLEDAAELAEDALARRIAAMGEEHPLIPRDVVNVARVLKWAGRYERALESYRLAQRLYRRIEGPASADEALVLVAIAEIHARQERFDLAVPALDEADRIFRSLPQTSSTRAKRLRWASVSKSVASKRTDWERFGAAATTELEIVRVLRPDDRKQLETSAFHAFLAAIEQDGACSAQRLASQHELHESSYRQQVDDALAARSDELAACP